MVSFEMFGVYFKIIILYLYLSSSVYIFRHNCLLTDLAYLHMTCHNYNGYVAMTDRTKRH